MKLSLKLAKKVKVQTHPITCLEGMKKKILHHGYSLIQKKLLGVDLYDYINL